MKKAIYLSVIVSFFLSIGPHFTGPLLKDAAADEAIGHFSIWQTNPETGDCGGYELWLTKSGNSLQGQLAVYEGNCESQKWNLENGKYDSKTGALSFKAPYYHNDFFWMFKGALRKDRISGTFSLFEVATKENTYNDKVILLRTPSK